jgi:uncharacterized protein YceK
MGFKLGVLVSGMNANFKLKIVAFLLTIICFCEGCGTITNQGKTRPGDCWSAPFGVYRGVRFDGSIIADGDWPPGIKVLSLVDIPFSAIADTIALPYDLSTLRTNKVNAPPNNPN